MVSRDLRALAERYGPYVLLALVVAFMFWVRMRPADRVITDTAVYFSGNDPWYHKRMVEFAVRHFPDTTRFDPYSFFPYGTGNHSGFGGLFDQLIALAALIVGAGDPSEHLTDTVLAVAPPVFGALTAVPTYVVAKRLTDRWSALLAAGILALLGGGILSRTVVGAADHQAAEALFGTIAVAGFAFAVATAYRESPMMEDVGDRNWAYLRESIVAGLVGGVAVASYLSLWAPGVMLLFTFGVFVAIQLVREHVAARPTDHVAFAAVVTMTTAGVLTLAYARSYTISQTEFSLLQPLVAFGVAFGTLLLFGLSRYAEREGYERRYYPLAVVALVLAALVLGRLIYPRSIDLLRQLFERIYSFGLLTDPTALTVVEIQPPTVNDAFYAFGLVFPLALFGMLLLTYHVYRENRPVELLVILWSLTMLSAYATMARFGYYLAVNVAILSAFAIWWVATRWLSLDLSVDRIRDVEAYQIIGVLVVLMLVLPGNVVAMSGSQPTWESSQRFGGTDQAWYEGLNWMQENTPEVPLAYYEQYERPSNGDFEYPEGAYGVMSWWDYGHWITVMGHRIPYANPFQQGPRPASEYLQATNETRANLILDALPSLAESPASVREMSNTELRDVVRDQTDQHAAEDGRYVAIDDEMAGGKFAAISQWAGPGQEEYFRRAPYQLQGRNVSLPQTTERYDRTMLAELYFGDASGLSHYRLVHEVDRYSIVGGFVQGQRVRSHTSLPLGGDWRSIAPTAGQLQRAYRSGQVVPIGRGSYVYNARVESQVKLYERVDGATLTGTVPEAENGTPVVAYVQLRTQTGRNFTYIQQGRTGPDGSFAMTVPYATDDSVGPDEGGTDSSVSALGEYTVQAGPVAAPLASGTVAVPEEAIYEGREIQVELEARQTGNASSGSGSGPSEPGGQSGSGNQSGGSGNETTGSLDAGRIAPPVEP